FGGGIHQGSRCLVAIEYTPSGVGYVAWPVATPNVRTALRPLKSVSLFDPRKTTITGPKFSTVLEAGTLSVMRCSGARRFVRSVEAIACVIWVIETLRPSLDSLNEGRLPSKPTT